MRRREFGLLPLAGALRAQQGRVVAEVKCKDDSTQGYALYVPSTYTADRAWPLLVGFDPRARGIVPVERFAAVAETQGWILAGSNNSRNGSWEVSGKAIEAMSRDVFARYQIDAKRVYAVGMSGGARVAMQVALGGKTIAGVIAASAAWPDGKVRSKLDFAVFGTAGTEDFNWLEMQELDRALKTAHRVRVFAGGHEWLPVELATEAVEWMELQAMRSGLRAEDAAVVERIFAARVAGLERLRGYAAWERTREIAADFTGLREEAAGYRERAKQMEREQDVKDGVKLARREVELELSWQREMGELEGNMVGIRSRLGKLVSVANGDADSVERRVARRVSRGFAASHTEGEYRKMAQEMGLGRGR